jgi:hypothetical protein
MRMPRFLILLFLVSGLKFFLPGKVCSQTELPELRLELSSHMAAGENAPFWLVSNRFGTSTPEKGMGSLRAGFFSDPKLKDNIHLSYGLEVINRYDGQNKVWFHQAYAEGVFFRLFRLKAGMREETTGNEYTPLSTGSIIWSSNARPIPMIEIGTPGYVEVPFTYGYFELKGSLAHGWFEKERYAKGVYLHKKNIYGRFGGKLPVNLVFGYNHMAMWGGDHPIHGKLPTDLDSFRRVFLAEEGDPDKTGTPDSWVINRFGNHLGSRNYGIDVKTEKSLIGAYMQDIFEDNSGRKRRNFPDGLWGIYWRSKEKKGLVTGVVYEYLQTSNQSGPLHDRNDTILGGDDNYFNHGTYQSGWTHHKMVIGTPFITSPVFNRNIDHPRNFRIWNNRVEVHHLGIEGNLPFDLDYRILLSYSGNMGLFASTISVPEEFHIPTSLYQWTGMMELQYTVPFYPLDLGLQVACDLGRMYGDNFGMGLRLGYRFGK